jgi:hypothetical protein
MATKIPKGEIDDATVTWQQITISRDMLKVKVSDDPPEYEWQERYVAFTLITDSEGREYPVDAPLSVLGTAQDRQGAKNLADALIQVGIAKHFKDPV